MIKNKITPDSSRLTLPLIPRNRSTPDSSRLTLPLIPRNRSGQEEMVGFAIILVIVSVIVLVLLGFMLNNPKDAGAVESYEVESFIQSSLQYTTDCETYLGFLPIKDLIIDCESEGKCLDERESCNVLNSTLNDLISKSWNVGEKSAIKGYKLKIIIDEQEKLILQEGNETETYKGGFQDFPRRGRNYEIFLNVYS